MMDEKATAAAAVGASLVGANGAHEAARARGRYALELRGPDGRLKWRELIDNLVTTAGKNDALDKYLKGSAYTAAWYLGLIDASGYSAVNAADTASSHGGWTESQAYSQGARPAATFGTPAAGSVNNSGSVAVYSINGTVTIKGVFLISNSTKGGTTGILYSAGTFAADRAAASGDTLNVTYTASL